MTAGIQGLPQLIQSRYGNPVILASITITDTNVHTYLTDPKSIFIKKLGTSEPAIESYAIWTYNSENQTVTVQPLTNIVNDGSYPDVNLIPSYTVNPGGTDWRMFPFSSYPIEYLSVALSFSTAPTLGNVTAPAFEGVLVYLYAYYK